MKRITLAGRPATLAAYEQPFGNNKWWKVDLYTIFGKRQYDLSASTSYQGAGDVADRAIEFLESILVTFNPGTDATNDVPAKPPNSRMELDESERLTLSDGTLLYQGYLNNNDSNWEATDVKLKLNLKDTSGASVWESEVSPSDDVIPPRDSTLYEIRVPPNAPNWETSQISWTWKWRCPA